MNNPYKTPHSSATGNVSVAELRQPKSAHWTYAQLACLGLAVCLMLAFTCMGVFLIWQAIQLGQAEAVLPPRLIPSDSAKSAIWGSWIGGGTALVAAVANLWAIHAARHNQILGSAALIAVSIAAIAVVSILFKP